MSTSGPLRFALASALALAACEEAPDPEQPAARDGEVSAHDAVSAVDWAAAGAPDTSVRLRLDAVAQRAVDEAPVPVLVPRWEDGLSRAVVLSKSAYYAFSFRDEGVTISLSGNRVAKVYPHIAPHPGTTSLRGRGGFVSQNEGIWAARWLEGGVAYALDVECAAHDDPRCAGESYVRELAENLAYVGGKGAAR
jgi:hypothetical protein